MGFNAAAKQAAARSGESTAAGRAMVAAGARKASDAAKRKNPNLTKVSGVTPPAHFHQHLGRKY